MTEISETKTPKAGEWWVSSCPMNDFREAIRNVAIEFQLSNVMIIGMLEIIQSEISREEMLRFMSRGPDFDSDEVQRAE